MHIRNYIFDIDLTRNQVTGEQILVTGVDRLDKHLTINQIHIYIKLKQSVADSYTRVQIP